MRSAHRSVFIHYLGEHELSYFYVFNNRYWFYFHKTFLFLIPTLHACVYASTEDNLIRALALTVLFKLSSFVKCF